jgi:hypothetical protein
MEVSIARGKGMKILRIFTEFLDDTKFVSRTKNAIIGQIFRDIYMDVVLECLFEVFAFGSLMIDRTAIQDGIFDIGGLFVGEDDFIKIVEICCQKRNKRQNSRDRNVSIAVISAAVEFE